MRASLLEDLQAFFLRWPIPILLTTQDEVPLPECLSGDCICFNPLSQEERRSILASYLTDGSNVLEQCFEPFLTPFELGLAAACASDISGTLTRTALLDKYVRRQLQQTSRPEAMRLVLRAIAREMGERLTMVLSLSDVFRIAEEVLLKTSAPLKILDELPFTKLIDWSQGRCAFRHELLTQFFQAEALTREHSTTVTLVRALQDSRNVHLAELIVGMQSREDAVRACLEVLPSTKILLRSMRGELGKVANTVCQRDLLSLFSRAHESLSELSVQIDATKSWIVARGPKWTKYDHALMAVAGMLLYEGVFVEQVLTLIEETEQRCNECLSEGLASMIPDQQNLMNHLFPTLYVLSSDDEYCLPVSVIVNACHNFFEGSSTSDILTRVLSGREDLSSQIPGVLYTICLILRRGSKRPVEVLPNLMRACWGKNIYHLRLEVLFLVQSFAAELIGELRDQVTDLLGQWETRNIFLSTTLIETLNCYGLVESPVSEQDATEQITEILKLPNDSNAQALAYGTVSNIFEDIYNCAYYNAIEGLSPNDRVALLTMAALGSPSYSFSADWILAELIRTGDNSALKAFQRWAAGIDPETSSIQDAVACYCLGVTGCAMHQPEPPATKSHATNDEKAWQLYGEILFWLHRPGLKDSERQLRCDPLWNQLRHELAFEAVDPVIQLYSASRKFRQGDFEPLEAVINHYKDQLRSILEFGFAHAEQLTTLFTNADAYLRKERLKSILYLLTELGNGDTANLLEEYIMSENGALLVEVIRKLRQKPA